MTHTLNITMSCLTRNPLAWRVTLSVVDDFWSASSILAGQCVGREYVYIYIYMYCKLLARGTGEPLESIPSIPIESISFIPRSFGAHCLTSQAREVVLSSCPYFLTVRI